MVDAQGGDDGTRNPGGAGDPFAAFATAVRDMCILGSFVVENALAPDNVRGATEGFAPFLDPMLRAASAFRKITEAGAGAFSGEWSTAPDGRTKAGDISLLVAQAYLAASVSGVRYWRRVAQTYGTHQSGILQSLLARITDSSMSDNERCALIDEIRAYLREIGDVSFQEARIFQSELEKLSAQVADVGGTSAEPSAHRRRWKAKS
jgi:hypothetical protein